MRLFQGASLVAGGITLAFLTGCSGDNVAGPSAGDANAPLAVGAETSSRPAALRRFILHGLPAHGTSAAVRQFIDFAAMAKNNGPTIAISDSQNDFVDLFTAAGTQVAQLTGFNVPSGMASDIKGALYVADQGNSRVQIYAAGFASPPTTLSDPGQYPLGVDSFANGTYIAVTNQVTTADGPGSVSIFKGSTLLRTITYSNLQQALFCAFDGKGNLYVDGLDGNGNVVIGEISHATSGGSRFEPLTTTNAIGFAAGIQVTTSGQIAIEDAGKQDIYTYNPPSGGSLGAPTQITSLGASHEPITFAFTKNMTNLYAADNANSQDAFGYAYPTGGTPASTIRVGGIPFGTAVIPTQYPSNSR
jgi:hypothetical protein